MEKELIPILPNSKQEAFLNWAVYDCFEISNSETNSLNDFFLEGGTIDAWCPNCKIQSVFNMENRRNIPYENTKRSLPIVGKIYLNPWQSVFYI